MCTHTVLLVYLFTCIMKGIIVEARRKCDYSTNSIHNIREGVMGQTALFPWLGILKVYIREEGSSSVALSGLVLVAESYALANAHDVANIPRRIFLEDSEAIFIGRDRSPRACRLRHYRPHPEFLENTNTVALIELYATKDFKYNIKPICWPQHSYNTSGLLFTAGYTDERGLLEKFVYKARYLDINLCKEFYARAQLNEVERVPGHYQCVYVENGTNSCVWDNGAALVSNATGHWVLVGMSIQGPGCAAPARFIDMMHYFPWIQTVTDWSNDERSRNTAFNEGFKVRRSEFSEDSLSHWNYPFDAHAHGNQYFTIDRLAPDAIKIINGSINDGKYGNCSEETNKQIYHDRVRIHASVGFVPTYKTAVYRLSLFDLQYMDYSCVMIKVYPSSPLSKETAYVYYKSTMDAKEGSAISMMGDTPAVLIQHPYPFKQTSNTTEPPGEWKPGPNLKPIGVQDKINEYTVRNINIYLKFQFVDEGVFIVKVFGPPPPRAREMPSTTVRHKFTAEPITTKAPRY